MGQDPSWIVGQTVREACSVPPVDREKWLSERCRGDATLIKPLEGLIEQAEASRDLSFLASGGAIVGPLWDRLVETLGHEQRLTSGSQVGRYVVLEEIGAGGMGVVYAAWDPELDRKVALKLLHQDLSQQDGAESRLRREAQAMARLSHENVIAVHDVGQWNQRVFVAMEFIEGEDLDSWQKQGQRGWREVLGVYRRAGRGLAAAHAADLVHRDFKPHNVLLGRDGQVRVLDFGLARSVHGATENTTQAELGVASPLPEVTQEGSISGTPAYMAPELLQGADANPGCDQFGFCVSLYQALWGELPFPAGSPLDLLKIYEQGSPPEPPAQARVPRWIQRAVLRGLAVDPADRWPEMGSLLEALNPDSLHRRSGWLAAAAVPIVFGVAWVALRPPETSLCQGAATQLSTVWNDARRQKLGEVFESDGTTPQGLFERTLGVLNGYSENWVVARTAACEATHVNGEQSGELLDLRMACLDRRRDELDALVDLFSEGKEDVLARASDAALSLEPLETCADTELLRAPIRRPVDPAVRGQLEALESRLAVVKASVDAGQLADTRLLAEELVGDADEFGFAPFEAEARWALADLVERLGEFDAARDEAFASWTAAERGNHEHYRLRALSLLVWIDGNDRALIDEAERWARLGDATLERLGGGDLLKAELENNFGAALQTAGRAEEALEHHRRALKMRTEVLGAESYPAAKSLNNIGSALFTASRYEEALGYHRQALELTQKILGPHAATALAWSNVGGDLNQLQRAAEARHANQEALQMRRLLFGEDSLWVGFSEINLAYSYLIDQPHEAESHLEAAARILSAGLPADHPYQGFVFSTRGHYLLAIGRASEAIPWLQRSTEIWAQHGISSPYEVATDQFALAKAYWPNDPNQALELAKSARDSLLTSSGDTDTPLLRDLDSWLSGRG